MESIYTKLALYGSKNECARTNNVFLPIYEVCDGEVSLLQFKTVVFTFTLNVVIVYTDQKFEVYLYILGRSLRTNSQP